MTAADPPPSRSEREKLAETVKSAIVAHVPDGYDQVDIGWSGPLARECLEALAVLAQPRQECEALRAQGRGEVTAPSSQPDARPWEMRSLRIGYPSAQHDWEPIASPAHKITGKDVLIHAQRHFAVRGEHYLTVRLSGGSITSRPVLDDESMADLPVVNGVVEMRLVKLI